MSAESEGGGITATAPSPPPATTEDPLGPVTISVINLVDLAGSERLSQAASEDVDREKLRQKEVSGGSGRMCGGVQADARWGIWRALMSGPRRFRPRGVGKGGGGLSRMCA